MEIKDLLATLEIEDVNDIEEFKTKFKTKFVSKANALNDDEIKSKITGRVAGAITTAKIASQAVTTSLIALNNVTTALIATNAVTSDKINALAVTNAKIADLAVGTTKLADQAVSNAKILEIHCQCLDCAIFFAKCSNCGFRRLCNLADA